MSRSGCCLWFGRCLALGLNTHPGPILKKLGPTSAHLCRDPGFAYGLGDVWLWVWICTQIQFSKTRQKCSHMSRYGFARGLGDVWLWVCTCTQKQSGSAVPDQSTHGSWFGRCLTKLLHEWHSHYHIHCHQVNTYIYVQHV